MTLLLCVVGQCRVILPNAHRCIWAWFSPQPSPSQSLFLVGKDGPRGPVQTLRPEWSQLLSWYQAKSRELEALQKYPLPQRPHPVNESAAQEAVKKQATSVLDALYLGSNARMPMPSRSAALPPVDAKQGKQAIHPLLPRHNVVQSDLNRNRIPQADASLSRVQPACGRRAEAVAAANPEASQVDFSSSEMDVALAQSRNRRQMRPVATGGHAPVLPAVPLPRQPSALSKLSPVSEASSSSTPTSSLWMRRRSPTVRPLEVIKTQKDLEAADEQVLLRRAQSLARVY